MFNKNHITQLIKRSAKIVINASSMRNQGKPGMILKIRKHLVDSIDISKLGSLEEKTFNKFIEAHTDNLVKFCKDKEIEWGTARKAINLFLMDIVYNKYLNEFYSLEKIHNLLEIPLDNKVSKRLKKVAKEKDSVLPVWGGICNIDKNEYIEFQKFALEIAKDKKMNRVDLDIYFWTEDVKDSKSQSLHFQ